MSGALRILRGCTLIINDNRNLALDLETLKLPTLEETKETFQPGGSDLEVEIAGLGMKALTLAFKLKTHDDGVLGLIGGEPGIRQNMTAKKFIVSEEDGTTYEHAIDITGRITKIDAEEMSGGKATGYDFEIGNIFNYTEYMDGKVLHRFSVMNGGWMVRNYQSVNNARRQVLLG